MIGYASRTGTRRNMEALKAAGWRIIVTPQDCRCPDGFRWALDNGAWTAFQQGKPFDEGAFIRALEKRGRGADWIVAPDIVEGGKRSLDMSLAWLPALKQIGPVLIAVQDGIDEADLGNLIGPGVGIFVGGSTEFKLGSMRGWAAFAHDRGAYCHVGRVNTARRIRLCAAAGVDSFDGTSASRFADTLPPLDAALRQSDLEGYLLKGAAA